MAGPAQAELLLEGLGPEGRGAACWVPALSPTCVPTLLGCSWVTDN